MIFLRVTLFLLRNITLKFYIYDSSVYNQGINRSEKTVPTLTIVRSPGKRTKDSCDRKGVSRCIYLKVS